MPPTRATPRPNTSKRGPDDAQWVFGLFFDSDELNLDLNQIARNRNISAASLRAKLRSIRIRNPGFQLVGTTTGDPKRITPSKPVDDRRCATRNKKPPSTLQTDVSGEDKPRDTGVNDEVQNLEAKLVSLEAVDFRSKAVEHKSSTIDSESNETVKLSDLKADRDEDRDDDVEMEKKEQNHTEYHKDSPRKLSMTDTVTFQIKTNDAKTSDKAEGSRCEPGVTEQSAEGVTLESQKNVSLNTQNPREAAARSVEGTLLMINDTNFHDDDDDGDDTTPSTENAVNEHLDKYEQDRAQCYITNMHQGTKRNRSPSHTSTDNLCMIESYDIAQTSDTGLGGKKARTSGNVTGADCSREKLFVSGSPSSKGASSSIMVNKKCLSENATDVNNKVVERILWDKQTMKEFNFSGQSASPQVDANVQAISLASFGSELWRKQSDNQACARPTKDIRLHQERMCESVERSERELSPDSKCRDIEDNQVVNNLAQTHPSQSHSFASKAPSMILHPASVRHNTWHTTELSEQRYKPRTTSSGPSTLGRVLKN